MLVSQNYDSITTLIVSQNHDSITKPC